MAISADVWRFQCDPNGDPDPVVQVFLRRQVTLADGTMIATNDTNPVPMRFSELGSMGDLAARADSKAKAANGPKPSPDSFVILSTPPGAQAIVAEQAGAGPVLVKG